MIPLSGNADQFKSQQDSITLDGKSYNKDQIIWDFTKLAFSETMWLENTLEPWKAISAYRNKKSNEKEYWWQAYTDRSSGIPKLDVINKFTTEITIAVGWPDLDYDLDGEFDVGPRISEIIKEEVLSLSPLLSSLTKLPVKFIDKEDPREKTKDFAKIRIVPIGVTGQKNRFKVVNHDPLLESENYLYNLQHNFVGAIPFTPESKTSVEGYLLPRSDNSIGMAVCKIISSLDEDTVRALIRECIVRSLGLTEESLLIKEKLVSDWNSFNEASSELLSDHSERSTWSSPLTQEQRKEFENFYQQDSSPKNFKLPEISEYEKLMMSILYCPEIKPGMNKASVIEELIKQDTCF